MNDLTKTMGQPRTTGRFYKIEQLEEYVIQGRNKDMLIEDIAEEAQISSATVRRILFLAGFVPPIRTCYLEECFNVLKGKQKKFCSIGHNNKSRTQERRLNGIKPRAKVAKGRFGTRKEFEIYVRDNCHKFFSNKDLAKDCETSYNAVIYVLYNKAW